MNGTNIQEPADLFLLFFYPHGGDNTLSVTMTHSFDTLIIISSNMIWLTSPRRFEWMVYYKTLCSKQPVMPSYPDIKCLFAHIIISCRKRRVFIMLTCCFLWSLLGVETAGCCCPLLDLKRYMPLSILIQHWEKSLKWNIYLLLT